MTQLLEKAFAEASRLPETQQDSVAAVVLEEIGSEERWEALFNQSADALAALANEALDEHRVGKTQRMGGDNG